jgi:hypothetical protein
MEPVFGVDVAFDPATHLVQGRQVTGVIDTLIQEVRLVIDVLEPLCP